MKKLLYLSLIVIAALGTTLTATAQTKKAGTSNSKFAFQSLTESIVEVVQSPTDVYFLESDYKRDGQTKNRVFALNKASGKLTVLIPDYRTSAVRTKINSIAWHPTHGLLFYLYNDGIYAYDGKSVETSTRLFDYGGEVSASGCADQVRLQVAQDGSIISWRCGVRIIEPDGKTLRHSMNLSDANILPMTGGQYAVNRYDTEIHIYQGDKEISKFKTHSSSGGPKPPVEIFNNSPKMLTTASGDSLYAYTYNIIFLYDPLLKEFKLVKEIAESQKYTINRMLQTPDGGFAIVPGPYSEEMKSLIFFDKDFTGDGTGGKKIVTDVLNPVLTPAENFTFIASNPYMYRPAPIVDQNGNYYVLQQPTYPKIWQLYVYNPNGIKGLDAIKGKCGIFAEPAK